MRANARRAEHLHTAVARLTHLHRALVLVCWQSLDVSALISSDHTIVLENIMHSAFVVSLDHHVVHAFEVNKHLLVIISKDLAWGHIILHHLLLVIHSTCMHTAHGHLIDILWKVVARKAFKRLAHPIHDRLYYPSVLLHSVLLDV